MEVIQENKTPKTIDERINSSYPSSVYLDKINEFAALMDQNKINLSFTALKEFCTSPLAFLRYKMRDKTPTDAMILGSLFHCLVLEPSKFKNKYVVLKKAKGFEENNWSKAENKKKKELVYAAAKESNKIVITESQLLAALDKKDALLSNTFAGELIRGCIQFEEPIKWKYRGFNFKGYIDGRGYNYMLDLKKVPKAIPEKIKWVQFSGKWSLQGLMYAMAKRVSISDTYHFYNICYDDLGNVCVVRQDWTSVSLAKAELDEIISNLESCMISEQWNYNLEFFTEAGFYNSSTL